MRVYHRLQLLYVAIAFATPYAWLLVERQAKVGCKELGFKTVARMATLERIYQKGGNK